jgi:hypothetical protein
MTYAIGAIGIGLGATFIMDLWNLLLKHVFGVPSLNYCMLGRWARHIPSGTFWHSSIAKAPEKTFECAVGWSAHYTIGLTLGVVFVMVTGDWISRPILLPALAYGVGTVLFPFFVLQPALGFGIASSKTKNPTAARLKSLMTHTVFGVGLFLCARALGVLVQFVA